MRERVKKHKTELIIIVCIWVFLLIVFMRYSYEENKTPKSIVSIDTFESNVSVIQNDDKVGANIRLLQSIHGTNGIDYRYSIDTDCPKWDFHTKYVTSTRIDWIDETAAVEVIIYDTQIRYENTVYASGQYYTVPLLDNISSESISVGEWQENLIKQAYQMYTSEACSDLWSIKIILLFIFGVSAIWFIATFIPVKSQKGETS